MKKNGKEVKLELVFEAPNNYMVTRSVSTNTKEPKKPEKYVFDNVDEIKDLMIYFGSMIYNIQEDMKRVPMVRNISEWDIKVGQ